MLNGHKHNQEKQTTLTMYIISKDTISQKRPSSQLSPSVEETSAKKANMFSMPSSQLSPSVEEISAKKTNMLTILLKDSQNNPISQQSPNPVLPTPAQSIGTTTLRVHNQQVTQQPCTSSSGITNTTEEGSTNMMNIDHISDIQSRAQQGLKI